MIAEATKALAIGGGHWVLQWSRDAVIAEASRAISDGDSLWWLQWSRDAVIAEAAEARKVVKECEKGFNGAAMQ